MRDTRFETTIITGMNEQQEPETHLPTGMDDLIPGPPTGNTNSPPGTAWASHNSPITQAVEPASNSTIQTGAIMWNSRGMSMLKRKLIKDLDKDFVLINEQFTKVRIKGYTIHESIDSTTKTGKVNVSIWHRESIDTKRHHTLECNNLIILQAQKMKTWLVCLYLRPRDTHQNLMTIQQTNFAISQISSDHPNDKILMFGDFNREDDMSEIYVETWLNRVSPASRRNHFNKKKGVITESTLTVVFANFDTKVDYIDESKHLSDHIIMTCEFDT